ncbi:MAG: PorT family protein [Fibrobacter sp.]|nr:PorT family protein [Fibrobacter sp.]
MSGNTFAQGVFEGTGEESASNCVGDGCGVEYPNQEQSNESYQDPAQDAIQDSTNVAVADSSVQDSSAADSTKNNVIDMDDEEDSRDYFVTESKNDYQARKEGFARKIQFGVRAGLGANTAFGKKSSGWKIGFDGNIGFSAALPVSRDFSVQAGIDYTYRRYNYEHDSDYGHNEALITEMLFEIPVMIRYAIVDDGFYLGLGGDIGLKMQGDSEFRQTIDTKDRHAKEKRSNTMPTEGVEIGAVADLQFVVNKHFIIDLRVVQNFSNLLATNLLAESSLKGSNIMTFHPSLGVSFML